MILKLQDEIPNNWSGIAKRMPGRSEASVKFRCKALLKKKKAKPGGGRKKGGMKSKNAPPGPGPGPDPGPDPERTSAEDNTWSPRMDRVLSTSPYGSGSSSPSASVSDFDVLSGCGSHSNDFYEPAARYTMGDKAPVAPPPARLPKHLCPSVASPAEVRFPPRQHTVPAPFHSGSASADITSANRADGTRGDNGRTDEAASLHMLSPVEKLLLTTANPVSSSGGGGGDTGEEVGMARGNSFDQLFDVVLEEEGAPEFWEIITTHSNEDGREGMETSLADPEFPAGNIITDLNLPIGDDYTFFV